MSEEFPKPSAACEYCKKPFSYLPNPNWQSVKQLFRLNPSRGYWIAVEHPECDQRLERDRLEEKARRARLEKHQLVKRDMRELGFAQILTGMPFEEFKVEAGNKRAFDAAQKWHYPEKGILLFGLPGRGKSHLIAALSKKWIEADLTVAFQSTSVLIGLLRRGYDDDVFDERLQMVSSQAQILVLDDLGAEKRTEWSEEKIYMIVDTRLSAKLPLFVTTNLTEQELEVRYHPRIVSRLREMCTWIPVGGPDWRARK